MALRMLLILIKRNLSKMKLHLVASIQLSISISTIALDTRYRESGVIKRVHQKYDGADRVGKLDYLHFRKFIKSSLNLDDATGAILLFANEYRH